MQREEKKKPKVRFTRGADGTIGLPQDAKKDNLAKLWSEQQAAFSVAKPTLKEDVDAIKKVLRAKKQAVVAKKQTKQPRQTKRVSFNATIPAMHVPRWLLGVKPAVIIVSVVAVIGGIGFLATRPDATSSQNAEVQGATESAIITNVTPGFPVLTPFGKGVAELGGFAKISPNGSPAVYAFADSIGEVKIRVSQQQLPDNLRTDQVTKLKELAEGFNAKTPLEIGDNTAYIGSSVNGAQSAVYIKGENLVLISSDNTIPNADWVTYIGNLKY